MCNCEKCANKKTVSKYPVKIQVGGSWAIDFEPVGVDKSFMLSHLAVAHANAYHDWDEEDDVDRHSKFAETLGLTRDEAKIVCWHYEWQNRRIAYLHKQGMEYGCMLPKRK